MPFGDNIIAHAKAQACALPCRLGGKKGLEDLLADVIRYPVTIILYGQGDLVVFPSRCYGHGRLKAFGLILFFLPDRMEGIGDQVQDHPANVLPHDIHLADRIVEISLQFGIEGFVLGAQPVISQA